MAQVKALDLEQALAACRICPRECGADRCGGKQGACGEGTSVRLARAALHMWEEPPISGRAGSGTVFFSGCSLKCVYCQNIEISRGSVGREVSVERLAQIFLEQQARGANNINLVTPTHFAPQICVALDMARKGRVQARPEVLEGIATSPERYPFARLDDCAALDLPIVWNTSGYERAETIAALAGYVDVFLSDFKYANPNAAQRYSQASDYPQIASDALDVIFALAGTAVFEHNEQQDMDLMKRGIIVRHLLLPGCLDDSKAVIDILAEKPYVDDIWVSLMSQFTPIPQLADTCSELMGTVPEDEYLELVDYALECGLNNSFMQEGEAVGESFIPAFDYTGI